MAWPLFGVTGKAILSHFYRGRVMVESSGLVPQRVREIGCVSQLLVGLAGLMGLGMGLYWWLSESGLYAWLAKGQQAPAGGLSPFVNALLVILLPPILCLLVGCLLVLWLRSPRYEILLPFTSCPIAERDLTVIRFAEVEAPDAGTNRVPGREVFQVIEGQLGERGWKTVLVNLSGVDFLPEKSLASLIVLKRRLEERGGQLVLCNLAPQIRQVFALTKLDKLLRICRNEDEWLHTP